MPTIQHQDIADTESHEPKNISTATAGQLYVADGAGSGDWAKLTESEMNYADKTKNKFGWNLIADSQYTSGSPRSISSATKTLITNNGLGGSTDTSRLGAIWDTTNSKFLINDANAAYLLRVTYAMTAASGTYAQWELEGGSPAGLMAGMSHFYLGTGFTNTLTIPIVLSTGINNTDIKLYLTSTTACTIWNVFFQIQRLYKET